VKVTFLLSPFEGTLSFVILSVHFIFNIHLQHHFQIHLRPFLQFLPDPRFWSIKSNIPNTTFCIYYLTVWRRNVICFVQCVRKVAVHLGYGTYICLSVSKLPLKCAVVSLYSVVKQRLKCNSVKVCNCLIQFFTV
jgi:hypothetical protein